MKQALAVAIMVACASFAVHAGESSIVVNKDVLAQVMELHGLTEDGAINRLAVEEEAADLYRRVRSMNLPGYAGAWFDAESGKLRVALSDSTQINLLRKV
jgi:streptogrisin C